MGLAGRSRVMRFPLRCTALVTVGLVLLPALALLRLPRPRAEGLGRLLPHAALLQSFPAAPGRPVPQLWQQRLPEVLVQQLWSQQRQLWWQFWGQDGAGGAYLVLPLPRPIRVGSIGLPPHSLEVDGLLVVAANPLAETLLRDQLKRAPRQQQGLQQRCLDQLQRRQAAYWTADGLGAMAGPMAPLLQTFQEGCVELQLVSSSLQFEGEAAATSGLVAPAPAASAAALPPPLSPDLLLQVSGQSLQPLLTGLLGRQLIREPLVSAYGLQESDLDLLQGSPFLLTLRPLARGPFQAGLELVVAPRGDRQAWLRMLDGIAERLIDRGMDSDPAAASTWRDDAGRVVGGWRWSGQSEESVQSEGPPLLQLFLGPEPPPFRSPFADAAAWQALPALRLQARPQALAAVSLLPSQLPMPLQQASSLELLADRPGVGDGGISRLVGRLALR